MDAIFKNFLVYYSFLVQRKNFLVSELKKTQDESEKNDNSEQSSGLLGSDLLRVQSDLIAQVNEFYFSVKSDMGYLSNQILTDLKKNLCAFSDEVILVSLGDQSYFWQKSLLEMKVFGTSIGGERFFDVVDSLLASHEKTNQEIAFLYAMMLRLGFRGRFRGQEGQSEIKSYLTSLVNFFHGEKQSKKEKKYIFLDSYQNIQHSKAALLFPSYYKLVINFCLFLLFYFTVYGLIWFFAISDVTEVINFIKQNDLIKF